MSVTLYSFHSLDYTMSICKLAGVFFPTKIPVSDILIRSKRLKKAKYSIWNSDILPDFVKKVWHYAWVLFFNGVALILGAGLIDPEVCESLDNKKVYENSNMVKIEPYIKNLKDLVDADKVLSNHPFVVGDLIRQEIEEWRTKQRQALIAYLLSMKSEGEREWIEYVC